MKHLGRLVARGSKCFRPSSRSFVGLRSRARGLAALALLSAGTLTGAAGVAPGFTSGLISFDYSWSQIGLAPYGSGAAVMGSTGDLWNTTSLVNPNPVSLRQSDGTATSVLWSINSGGGLASPYLGGTYGELFDANQAFYTARISGLTPNQEYSLCLFDTLWAERLSVNGVAFTLDAKCSETVDALRAGIDYDMHIVTADASGTLSFSALWAQYNTPYLTSWQLAPVPEPSSLALAGLGAATCLLYRRRK